MKEEDQYFRALSQYRMEQAEQAVSDAELLLKEKRYRAAANRMYYACFYAASSALLTKRLQYSKHSAVIVFFDKTFIKTGIFKREHSRTLHLAFNERQEDDYKPFAEPDPGFLRELYERVKNLTEDIRRFIDDKNRGSSRA